MVVLANPLAGAAGDEVTMFSTSSSSRITNLLNALPEIGGFT